MPGHSLVVTYLGCSGRMRFPSRGVPVEHECVAFNDAGAPAHNEYFVRQWLNPAAPASDGLPQPVAGARLVLSGAPGEPCSAEFVERIVRAVTGTRYESVAQVEGELAGGVVTNEKVILFRNLASADVIFYRRSGSLIEWSTNPADLLHDPLAEIDRERIWRSCRGDSIFVYRGLDFVRPGQLVIVDENSTRTVLCERLTPLDLPRRTTLRDYAALTYDLLVQAARPYADSGHIGVLLSGGIDSSLVLAALVDSGADVTAYHIGTDDPLADESAYAREVCRQLSVPMVSVTTTPDRYFSTEGDFPHPYNHVWFHRTAEIADRIQRDGVTLLASGRDGDFLFGPDHYGLHDILVGDLSWGEKWQMALGLLCHRWELRRIVNSVRPSHSLVGDPEAVMLGERPVDFLVPMPDVPYETESDELGFWPQELTLNLTVWRPRGIYCSCPMGSTDLRRLAMRLPDAYRLIPYRGRMITKPVLRLAGSTRLPATTWRHHGIPWLASPDETWCLNHVEIISDLLGGPDSRLVEIGIVDPARLAAVLTDPAALRRNAETLVCAAMTELFLRSVEKRTPHRMWS